MDDPILEYRILDTVHRSDGKLTQSHISKKIGRSVASVNFGIRMLAVKGFIKILRSPAAATWPIISLHEESSKRLHWPTIS